MADYKSQSVMGSQEGLKFNCIITGAGGFVGQALAASLLADPLVSKLTLTDVFEPDVPQTKSRSSVETRCLEADLTSLETCQSLFTPDINLIYLLHGIMSGAAEANLELGLQVVRRFRSSSFLFGIKIKSRTILRKQEDLLLPRLVLKFHSLLQ